jgi:2-oxoisovalerate dehydrogenase E1 component
MAGFLTGEGILSEEALEKLKAEVDEEINAAADRAIAARVPEPESATEFVYSPDVDPTAAAFETPGAAGRGRRPTTMVDLINACLRTK